ncbi:MAG TPA: Zn-dependent alcohol dehydrogenase [Acidimicrobiales bacterium]|jgi:Zn-dependent alcohol dehydrogenase|nr:Zn-dependent alcohol dehydrogenase [Acidimicrobiales bacterium]
MRAALLETGNTPLNLVDDIDVAPLTAGQVRVRVANCGICHSDLTMIDSDQPALLPIVLGHEAAGTVEEVGPGVRSLAPGDHVLLAALAPCGRCYWCVRGQASICEQAISLFAGRLPDGSTPLSRHGSVVYRGLGVGGFGEVVVTTDTGAVKIDPDIPLDVACLVGCALQTGVGAVLNTAKVEEGATVLIMGLGGIGISVVQGARVAGASRIIVSDPNGARRDASTHFGATDVLDPTVDDVVAETQRLTGGIGVDYAFDAAGHARLIETGIAATRRGGTTVCVGAPAADQSVTINPAVMLIVTEKKLLGCLYGSANAHREVPRLLSLWRRGALDLESMISYRRPLAEINDGLDDLRAGRGIRTVLSL